MTIHWHKTRLLLDLSSAFIGARWQRYSKALDLYVCLLPCVAINVYLQWE